MKKSEKMRQQVAQAYAKTITGETGGCCGGGRAEQNVITALAGYSPEELAATPDGAATSFGCGNPVAFAEVRGGEVVLDLGCGAGLDLLLAARQVGPGGRVIGVDMTEEMLAKARENVARSGLTNVEVRQGIIEELPVETGSVDLVISNCVINLSPEKRRVFAEIARVLKPGGRMLISDIVAEDLPAWARGSMELFCSCVAGAISEQEYLAGLREAGLADAEVRARLVYDAEQIGGYLNSGEAQSFIGGVKSCCGNKLGTAALNQAARALAGKFWSAKFYARKP